MEQAAFIFVGSILLAFTAIVVVSAILIINNLFHRYWKPWTIYTEVEHQPQEPTLRKEDK